MSQDFFLAYPEQTGDIPVYNSGPNWVSATTQIGLGRLPRLESPGTSSPSLAACLGDETRLEHEEVVVTPDSDTIWDIVMAGYDFGIM